MKFHFNPPAPDCTLVVRDSSQLPGSGLRREAASLLPDNAAQKRKNEFALGRAAARQALTELGFSEPPPVLRGAGREPLWPEGVVGSITHCAGSAIAVVARREHVKAIGIDLENSERVPQHEIVSVVSNEREQRWIFGSDDSQLRLAMLFSAKESVYKALYPLSHRFFDFHALELTWLPELNIFRGWLRTSLSEDYREGSSIDIGCQIQQNFVFTHAIVAPHTTL